MKFTLKYSITPASLVSAVLLVIAPMWLHAQATVQGKITDAETGLPLPYATVMIVGSELGSTSDIEGVFYLQTGANNQDSIRASYLGYESQTLYFNPTSSPNINISLKPYAHLLEEVVVRPMSPQELLRRVKRKAANNNAREAFNATAYYQEWMRENSDLINHQEALFYSWINGYQKDSEQSHQVVAYRQADTEQLEFMRKKAEKKKKKYLKKHPEKAADFEDGQFILTDFGGPKAILGINTNNNSLTFLDSTQHHKFDMSYGKDTHYEGRPIIIIDYAAKRAIENLRQRGRVYIDANSESIVCIEEEGDVVIPFIARPILLAMGLSVKNPRYTMRLKLREMDDIWYPQYTHWQADFKIKKAHLFSKNESSNFSLRQELAIKTITTEQANLVATEKAYNTEEKMKDQVHPKDGINWD